LQVEVIREPKPSKIDHLFVVIAEEGEAESTMSLPPSLEVVIREAIARSAFAGRNDESITILSEEPKKLTLLGAGKEKELTIRGARAAAFSIGKIARRARDRRIAVVFPYALPGLDDEETTALMTDILSHADYKYDDYVTVDKKEKRPAVECAYIAPVALDARAGRKAQNSARAVSDAVRTVRDLGNGPGNLVTPSWIAARAREVAQETGVKCTVYGLREIERMKMGGLLAVNRGSIEEPKFIVLEYAPKKARRHVALVGKGITFDSGGISIKPADKMEEMKFDMCGAAAVIGTIQAAAALELPIRLTGLIPSTDNLPSGSAYKPGDIITMMSGKTVEIVNTDAEGRMILADALHYASTFEPDHLIDFATLTGACVVALGNECSGLFSNDDELAQKLITAGERVGERLWRLPAWDEYKESIRSEWADMKNSGGRWGGAITAALFLKEFVNCPSWAHIDIAGTAYTDHDNGREAKGATGVGVRATIEFLRSLS
jgi:leucyl aminopeptidase